MYTHISTPLIPSLLRPLPHFMVWNGNEIAGDPLKMVPLQPVEPLNKPDLVGFGLSILTGPLHYPLHLCSLVWAVNKSSGLGLT